MKLFVVMRGVPGAGKTTLARQIALSNLDVICSADNYLMENGLYVYKPEKLSAAHTRCFQKVKSLMWASVPLVILDNTNIKRSWFKDYVTLANTCGYLTWECFCGTLRERDAELYAVRNHHGLTEKTILKYMRRFEL